MELDDDLYFPQFIWYHEVADILSSSTIFFANSLSLIINNSNININILLVTVVATTTATTLVVRDCFWSSITIIVVVNSRSGSEFRSYHHQQQNELIKVLSVIISSKA
jgi:capsular polysaccharide biosynthesis protein